MRAFTRERGDSRIVFGPGAEARAADTLIDLGAERVLLICTPTRSDGARRVAEALGDRCVGLFDGARQHVPREVADAAVARARELDADWVVGHGGGTPVGVAKAVALEVDVKVGAITTTYSGSEMTNIWGVSEDGEKTTGRDDRVRPRLVVYDPELLSEFPFEIARLSLYNALAHAVEAIYSEDADEALKDQATEAAGALVRGLRGLHVDSGDLDAVSEALYGAMLSGEALDQASMALHHKLAHTLGGSFGTPHAETHAILLPHTLAFNGTPDTVKRLGTALGTAFPATTLYDLAKDTGIPTRLSSIGLSRADVSKAAKLAMKRQYSNPRPLTEEAIAGVLTDALLGRRPTPDSTRLELPGPGPHGALPVAVQGPPLPEAEGVILAVHGRGSSAERMLQRIGPQVPRTFAVLAPQADANTWYPKGFRDVEANKEGLDSAFARLDGLWELATRHVAPEKVVVVGWSQGACLVLSWLSRAPGRPGGLVAWTGAAIPGYDTYSQLADTRIAVGTAAGDPWVELAEVRHTVEALRAAGAAPVLHVDPGDQHGVRPADRDNLAKVLRAAATGDALDYLTGYGSELHSEALPGALPREQNNPLQPKYGLHAEQLQGTGFTLQRHLNLRTWMYRLRPQVPLAPWEPLEHARFAGTFEEGSATPQILRYRPQPLPTEPTDFLDGIVTFAGAGDPTTRTGMAIHLYAANRDMEDRVFSNADGDLLVVPQEGSLRIRSELGWLHVSPGEIAVLPRGIRYQVFLPEGTSRGWLSELFNGHHLLPERGPIGANGLADERHFKAPVADFEDREQPFEHVHKHAGRFWCTTVEHSPFDVVAWHGSYLPWKYDLLDFTAYWSVTKDHSDPSVLTVLTCPHDPYGRNALDFAVFRGRWDATEHTFRPPWFHRNSAVEFNAVVKSPATGGPWVPGAFSFTPYLSPHGVSARSTHREARRGATGEDRPRRGSDEELWIQWESTYPMKVMPWMLDAEWRDEDYLEQFRGFQPAKVDL